MSMYIPTRKVDKPCEECGTSPALEYTLAGITGVLCEKCLNKEVENVNNALAKKTFQDKPISELTYDDIPW